MSRSGEGFWFGAGRLALACFFTLSCSLEDQDHLGARAGGSDNGSTPPGNSSSGRASTGEGDASRGDAAVPGSLRDGGNRAHDASVPTEPCQACICEDPTTLDGGFQGIAIAGGPAQEHPDGSALLDLSAEGELIARVPNPTGGGSKDLEILRDGERPPQGHGDNSVQYDTFDGQDPAMEDWFGYTFSDEHVFERVAFLGGLVFDDGGWFTEIGIQIRQGGLWWTLCPEVTPSYPGDNSLRSYSAFEFSFAPVPGDGIRLYGVPGGSSAFTSVAELRVFGH